MERCILHMDMDAFFASVEVRDNPALVGQPLIIGALPSERGVVSTCSYEARTFGVHSGMSIKEAYRLCPQGVYMHGSYAKYRAVSDQIHGILSDYTDQLLFVALDEGYLDITGSRTLFGGAEAIGHEIKARVLAETQLPCSVGIGYNMMSAKLASEEKKPNGFFVIPDADALRALIRHRPVSVLNGIGHKSALHLKQYGIHTIEDLWAWDCDALVQLFGQFGAELYRLSRGIDDRRISSVQDPAKSYGREITYQQDLLSPAEMNSALRLIARQVSIGLQHQGLWAQTVILKFKYDNLESHTRSFTLAESTNDADILFHTAQDLLHKSTPTRPVRLLGISTRHLTSEPIRQLSLEDEDSAEKKQRLNQSLLSLYDRFGKNIVKTGAEIESEKALKPKE